MRSERKNSNALGSTPTRRQLIAGMALAFGGLTPGATEAWASTEEEISRTAESIHQEHVFKASRKRVLPFRRLRHGKTTRTCAERANRASVASRQLGRGRLLDREISAGGARSED